MKVVNLTYDEAFQKVRNGGRVFAIRILGESEKVTIKDVRKMTFNDFVQCKTDAAFCELVKE